MHSCACIYHAAQNPPRCHTELFEESSPAWRLRAFNEPAHGEKKHDKSVQTSSKSGSWKFTVHVKSLQNLSIDRAGMVNSHLPSKQCNASYLHASYTLLAWNATWDEKMLHECVLACCNEHSHLMLEGVRSSGGLRAVEKGKPWEQSYLEKRLSKSREPCTWPRKSRTL